MKQFLCYASQTIKEKFFSLLAKIYCVTTVVLFSFLSTKGQVIPSVITDSLVLNSLVPCGISSEYIENLGTPIGLQFSIDPPNFPAAAIEHCGKFDIYYEDLITTNPAVGFGDPVYGAVRRNTLCAVLTNIQTVFDFGNVPANAPIRLIVYASYSASVNPAPVGTTWLARGGPFYDTYTTPQILNGFVRDYAVNGTDPASSFRYHAQLIVNFDQIPAGNIPWHDNFLQPIPNCSYDLYSALLHEMGHALGWISFMEADNVTNFPQSHIGINHNHYTRLDLLLHKGTNNFPLSLTPLVLGAPASPVINPLFSSSPTAVLNNEVWLNSLNAPNNAPVYSGYIFGGYSQWFSRGSILHHLDDQMWAYSERARISPGNAHNYVMGPFGATGMLRRQFTDIEINAFLTFGYSLNPSYTSNSLSNSPPFSTRMASYSSNYHTYFAFPETVAADFPPLVNNVASNLVINLANDNTLIDAENDPISVASGSLVNIRGCGNGGNNHNSLSISPNGRIITYTPRPNFYGRAQFGFRLFDGKEEGSYVVYTIDVLRGTNVNCADGSNIVLNGDFEEGTEVKRLGGEETIEAAQQEQDFLKEGKFARGTHFGDCQPYNYISNNWTPFGAGDMVNNSYINCNGTSYTSRAGYFTTSFPVGTFSPPAPNGIGQRYRRLYANGYFNLCSDVQPCSQYILEFDYYTNTTVANVPLTIAFSNSTPIPPATAHTYSFVHSFTATGGSWQHITIPFTYCGTLPASILSLIQTSVSPVPGLSIDNLRLQRNLNPPPALSVSIAPSTPTICSGSNIALSSTVTNALCNVTYSWSPATGLSCTNCANPTANPTSTTTYSLTVNDGCRSATTSRTVTVNPFPSASISPPTATICNGGSVILTASGGTGYSWSNGLGTGASKQVTPNTSTTYTVTVTNAQGCSATASRMVNVTAAFSANITPTTTTNSTDCGSQTVTLAATPTGTGYTYAWSLPAGNTATTQTVTAYLPGTYTVTVTNPSGCTGTMSVTRNLLQVSSGVIIGSLAPSSANSSLQYYINQGWILPTSGTINAANTAQYIRVKGVLNVDVNYSFASGSVITALEADGGTVINVNTSTTFNLTGTLLQGCTKMWKGISLSGGNVLFGIPGGTITMSGCTIQDALYGILANGKTTIGGITGTTFKNNLIGIAGGGSILAPISQTGNFYGNSFKSEGTYLKQPYPNVVVNWGLPLPVQGRQGFSGLYFNSNIGGSIMVGTANQAANTFRYLANGIVSIGQNLTVINSTFADFQPYGYSHSIVAYGIYAKGTIDGGACANGSCSPIGHNLLVTGNQGTVSFTNVNYAIYATKINTTVAGCAVQNATIGIWAALNRYGYTSVTLNNISSSLYGVYLDNNDPYFEQTVARNTIANTGFIGVGSGIHDMETGQAPLSGGAGGWLNANNITVTGTTKTGIYVNAANTAIITGHVSPHYITINNPTVAKAGIELNGCTNYAVAQNNIAGTSSTTNNGSKYPAAILLGNGTTTSFICENTTGNTYAGLLFAGTNTDVYFGNNTFGSHYNGLWVDNPATISPQKSGSIPNLNQWTGTYNMAARHWNSSGVQSQQIYYQQNSASQYHPSSVTPNWFFLTQNNGNGCCGLVCKDDGTEDADEGLTNFQRSVINKTFRYPSYNDELQWQVEDQLYATMRDNTALQHLSGAEQFYADKTNGSTGKLARFRDKVRDYQQNNPYVNPIRELQEKNRLLANDWISADSLLAAAVTEDARENAQQQVNTIREQMNENSDQLQQLGEQLTALQQGQAEELLNDNRQIAPENLVPQNEKLFNEVWLQTKFQNRRDYTKAQIRTLEYLAFQCPLQGGTAVYKARSLYKAVKDTVYDDDRLCASAPRTFKTDETISSTLSKELNIVVYPNPAENSVFVSITGLVEEDIQLEWTDALGRIVQMNTLQASKSGQTTYSINTAGLVNGVYQIIGKENGVKLYSGKLVIAK